MRLDSRVVIGECNYNHLLANENVNCLMRKNGHAITEARYYIHADSLNLLRPQIGDLWIGKEYQEEKQLLRACYMGDEVVLGEIEREMILVQRNGISFMWPKSEK